MEIDSNIYFNAATRVDYKRAENDAEYSFFSCYALMTELGEIIDYNGSGNVYEFLYQLYFLPDNGSSQITWFDEHDEMSDETKADEIEQLQRHLALLFMEQIIKDGEYV